MSEEIINNAPEQEELTAEQVSSLRQVRIGKLDELKAAGKDPFQITKFDVSASCLEAKMSMKNWKPGLKHRQATMRKSSKSFWKATVSPSASQAV